MSNGIMMDPQDFAERLERSFGGEEPPHADPADDLAHGRRRLSRRRAGTAVAALATLGILTAGGAFYPHQVPEPAPAAAPRTLTSAEILTRCTSGENAFFQDGSGQKDGAPAVALLGDTPRLMTSAVIDNRTEATLLAQDGEYWGQCQFRNSPENGVKNALSVFPTDVTFPRTSIGGVEAYEPASEADPRFLDPVDPPLPQFETPCVSNTNTEAELATANARCPTFTIFWNDRRPTEVPAARVTTPDGVSSWADVTKGYVSFAYTGDMTPAVVEQVAAGNPPGATRVVLYDKDGNVLVDDRDPGHLPRDGSNSIAHFPSLARWLK